MRYLILILTLLFGACAVDVAPVETALDEQAINGDGGVCTDSSGHPCFCGSASCNDGGNTGGGPGGGTGGGGGYGNGTPSTVCVYLRDDQCWGDMWSRIDWCCTSSGTSLSCYTVSRGCEYIPPG